ncbi:MAG: hypothetical protein H0V73_07835 [Chloroflexi bacterium]|nr:hypothetical protein [Chloroflexota bacterium]
MLAGLAVAGTSPAPTRAPTLSRESSGVLTLSPDEPAATVEVTVLANAALLADATNRTVVGVRRVPATGEGPDSAGVVMAIEAVEGKVPPVIGSWPSLSDDLKLACQFTGDCTRAYRITATLAGPVEGPVTVGWLVTAETRMGTDASPGVAPAGAALTITAGKPAPLAAGSLSASVDTTGIRLDAAHPRFVRVVTLVQPPRADGTWAAGVLRSTITRDSTASYEQPVALRVEMMDGTVISSASTGVQDVALPGCDDPDGCRTQLRVVGDWQGGPKGQESTVDWTLGGSLFTTDPGAIELTGKLSLEPVPLVEDKPIPAGGTTHSLLIGGDKTKDQSVNLSIDGRAIHGSDDGKGVFVQATMSALSRSKSGSEKSILFRVGSTGTEGVPGADLHVVSTLFPVKCGGGSCTATIPISAWVYGTPVDDVTLDWTLDAALVVDPGITVDANIQVGYSVQDRP